MPNRVLRDGLLTSEKINHCSDSAQMLFVRIMLIVDDYGRFHGIPELIKSACYPFDSKLLSDVSKLLSELITNDLIMLYEVDNKKYMMIKNFNQRLRQMKIKYPAPTDDSKPLSIVSNPPPESETNPKRNEKYTPISELLKKRILEKRQQKVDDNTIRKWNNAIRLMIERDNRNEADIVTLINECHDMPKTKSGFTWADNILSMDKLRERWNEGKIYVGLNSNKQAPKKEPEYFDVMAYRKKLRDEQEQLDREHPEPEL